jgi:molecular chaperone DnaK (HSP70)
MEVMSFVEAIPMSIGVDIAGDLFSKVIHRNSPMPVNATQTYHTCCNDQDGMSFPVLLLSSHFEYQIIDFSQIYEGERIFTKNNNYLGELVIGGLPEGMARSVSVNLSMEVNRNGGLMVRAAHGV